MSGETTYPFTYRDRLLRGRKNTLCRIVSRGVGQQVIVEFKDGARTTTQLYNLGRPK